MTVSTAYLWENGNLMVFDQDGQQIAVARSHTIATRVSAQRLALNERRRVTHLSETTSKDLIVATTDLFGNDFLV